MSEMFLKKKRSSGIGNTDREFSTDLSKYKVELIFINDTQIRVSFLLLLLENFFYFKNNILVGSSLYFMFVFPCPSLFSSLISVLLSITLFIMYLALRKRLSSNGFDHHDLQSCDRGDIATDFFSLQDVYICYTERQ